MSRLGRPVESIHRRSLSGLERALGQQIGDVLDTLPPDRPVAIAVSGGPDSVCLMHATAQVLKARGEYDRLLSLSVDHGLRAGSEADAQLVADFAAELGTNHQTLTWSETKPQSGIHAAARSARYRLLVDEARRCGASGILFAHHLDDQSETVLMRLARTPSLRSLAAIAPQIVLRDGLRLIRPLLAFTKDELERLAKAWDLTWALDPANLDPRFERTRIRDLMTNLVARGVDVRTFAKIADRARTITEEIDQKAIRLLDEAAHVSSIGRIRLSLNDLDSLPSVTNRVLARLVVAAGGADRFPAPDQVDRLIASKLHAPIVRSLRSGERMGLATLSGCLISIDRHGDRIDLIFEREPGRMGGTLASPRRRYPPLWDKRFQLSGEPPNEDFQIIAIGRCRQVSGRLASLPVAVSVHDRQRIIAVAQHLADHPEFDGFPVIRTEEFVSTRLIDPNLATVWEFL